MLNYNKFPRLRYTFFCMEAVKSFAFFTASDFADFVKTSQPPLRANTYRQPQVFPLHPFFLGAKDSQSVHCTAVGFDSCVPT